MLASLGRAYGLPKGVSSVSFLKVRLVDEGQTKTRKHFAGSVEDTHAHLGALLALGFVLLGP